MTSKEIIDKLREDKHYYGKFGQQYLSNSNISTLLDNPLALREPQKQIPAFLVGGYFHTAILEPEKLRSFKVNEASNRNQIAIQIIKISQGQAWCFVCLQTALASYQSELRRPAPERRLQSNELLPLKIDPDPTRSTERQSAPDLI